MAANDRLDSLAATAIALSQATDLSPDQIICTQAAILTGSAPVRPGGQAINDKLQSYL